MTKLSRPVGPSDFRSAPENICKTAMFEDEDGIVFAFGHVPVEVIQDEVPKMYRFYFNDKSLLMSIPEETIQHSYAKIQIPKDFQEEIYDLDSNDEEFRFIFADKDDEDAFPITVVG